MWGPAGTERMETPLPVRGVRECSISLLRNQNFVSKKKENWSEWEKLQELALASSDLRQLVLLFLREFIKDFSTFYSFIRIKPSWLQLIYINEDLFFYPLLCHRYLYDICEIDSRNASREIFFKNSLLIIGTSLN